MTIQSKSYCMNNEFLGNKNLEKSGYGFEKLPGWKKSDRKLGGASLNLKYSY